MYAVEVNSDGMILQHVEPLLCNRRVNNGVVQLVSRKIGKHVPEATNTKQH
jgi:hypothetical protein